MSFRIFLLFVLFQPFKAFSMEICQKWFKNIGIEKKDDCLVECSVAETDMGAFHCPNSCAILCKTSNTEKFLFNIFYYYGLNQEERALSAKYPKKMLLAYQLSRKAEKLCLTLYKTSETNDESDACRHFVWSILLYKEFGLDFSRRILNAHEQTRGQPLSEKSMDLANNRMGLIAAQGLKKAGKLNNSAILNSFKKHLKSGYLIVIEKTHKTKGGKK